MFDSNNPYRLLTNRRTCLVAEGISWRISAWQSGKTISRTGIKSTENCEFHAEDINKLVMHLWNIVQLFCLRITT
jgi:hypothetical protein